jgi:hypothetical protein
LTQQYSYVRYRWIEANLDDLEKKLAEFHVERRQIPTSINDISPYNKYREYLFVKADTLDAVVSPLRVLLSQREKLPFTEQDLKLREIILLEYPKSTSTLFPWGFSKEPVFETETGESSQRES